MPVYAIYMEPQYRTWRDRADNIGVQCLECNRTFWTGFEPTYDPTIGQDCTNCLLIKSADVLKNVNADKTLEGTPFTQPAQVDATGRDVIEES